MRTALALLLALSLDVGRAGSLHLGTVRILGSDTQRGNPKGLRLQLMAVSCRGGALQAANNRAAHSSRAWGEDSITCVRVPARTLRRGPSAALLKFD